ncbi:FAD-dependent oxidoreductase [Calothrix sp. 336/3]|uniref:FAD-dependent oxidoreductase n=1 Tax=Calothrix sp. 336/3 TaxID=1337936 RepID=UPI0004E4152B|nr:FAD-dependent oxidoreductase [Calothrix sp. 336/3]AKG24230.1 glucose-inhibited division protein A [Calothrix sp. 336/3]
MVNHTYKVDVLVVGGGVGGTTAAIQAARRGVKTLLVSEFTWLGGMLTSAGVSAPDGNELAAFQTGFWGAYLQELLKRQPGGLDNSWVSFFSYEPRIGAEIFADWVGSLANLQWISGQVPLEVISQENRVTGVRFADFEVEAEIILDGTELGDLLALGDVPYRWGWELQGEWGEKSAPTDFNFLTERYPVQAPTWVVMMQDFGAAMAPEITPAPNYNPSLFSGAWDDYGAEKFLDYGRLPGNRFMINWPLHGNDYGEGVGRLIHSEAEKSAFLQESYWHSQNFAYFIQNQLGRRYGLAEDGFPGKYPAFALHPYYRESRRVIGLTTIREQDILPQEGGQVAALYPDAIAIGNYANDHHYPDIPFPLQPKSIRWGGRWTGTPFTIPYRSLVPATTDGLLVCEKNISVSHIANGATRLQPVVMGIGQAAGMAAAMCIEKNCQPRDLPVQDLQIALIQDRLCPMAIIPLFNLHPQDANWLHWQLHYLDNQPDYPPNGYCPHLSQSQYSYGQNPIIMGQNRFTGIFQRLAHQDYRLVSILENSTQNQSWQLVTWRSPINEFLENLCHGQFITVYGRPNHAGGWLLIEQVEETPQSENLS